MSTLNAGEQESESGDPMVSAHFFRKKACQVQSFWQ
jgi:hypothetical protein